MTKIDKLSRLSFKSSVVALDTYFIIPFSCYQTLYYELTHKAIFISTELNLMKAFYSFICLNALEK